MNVTTERYELLISQWQYLKLRVVNSEETPCAFLMVDTTKENVIDAHCTRFEHQLNCDYNHWNIFTTSRVNGFRLIYEIQQFTARESRRIFIIAYFMR